MEEGEGSIVSDAGVVRRHKKARMDLEDALGGESGIGSNAWSVRHREKAIRAS